MSSIYYNQKGESFTCSVSDNDFIQKLTQFWFPKNGSLSRFKKREDIMMLIRVLQNYYYIQTVGSPELFGYEDASMDELMWIDNLISFLDDSTYIYSEDEWDEKDKPLCRLINRYKIKAKIDELMKRRDDDEK